MRATIRVRGVTYKSPDEARVAAEEIRHRVDELAHDLRADGNDAQADQVQDRGHADAERLQEFARELEAGDAAATPQPEPLAPRSTSRIGQKKTRGNQRRSPRSRRSSPALTPRARTIVRQTGIPSAASSATSLALQFAGLTLGIAFLTLLLTGRGVSAFASLAGGAANGLRWIVDPTDPLAPRPKPAAASSSASSAAASAARSSPPRRRLTVAPLTVGVG